MLYWSMMMPHAGGILLAFVPAAARRAEGLELGQHALASFLALHRDPAALARAPSRSCTSACSCSGGSVVYEFIWIDGRTVTRSNTRPLDSGVHRRDDVAICSWACSATPPRPEAEGVVTRGTHQGLPPASSAISCAAWRGRACSWPCWSSQCSSARAAAGRAP